MMNTFLRRLITFRRAQRGDAAAVGTFLQRLSAQSRRLRFHGACSVSSPSLLKLLCEVDGLDHQAWFAWAADKHGEAIVGEARFVRTPNEGTAELAIVVADEEQGSGVAQVLIQRVLDAAAAAQVDELYADVIVGNDRMAAFLRRNGFDVDPMAHAGVMRMRRRLVGAERPVPALAIVSGWLRSICGPVAGVLMDSSPAPLSVSQRTCRAAAS